MALTSLEKYKKIQNELVAEQSGLTTLLIGLIFSFVVGTWVKSWMGPDTIEPILRKSIAEISLAPLQIQFQRAFVSLSQNGWPEVALVIQEVSVKSENLCWARPELQVHQARLPLSFRKLLMGEIQFSMAEIDQAHLLIRDELKNCSADPITQAAGINYGSNSVSSSGVNHETESDLKSAFKPAPNQVIEQVRVDQLFVHYLPRAFTSIEMRNTTIDTKTSDSSIVLSSLLILQGETFFGDYSSKAQLELFYHPQSDAIVTLQLSGLLREGQYQIESSYLKNSQTLKAQLSGKHLPVSYLEPILRKYHLLQRDLNAENLWLSIQGNFEKKLNSASADDLNVKIGPLKIEGDLGEVVIPELSLEHTDPPELKPFRMMISSLNLNALLNLFDLDHPSDGIGNLGTFRGDLFFEKQNNIKLQGDLSGLEFIFSNQGSRVAQTLTLASGVLNLDGEQWNLALDQLKLLEGVFLGSLQLDGDRSFKKIKIKTQFEDLTFSPSVQRLMTLGGDMGSFSGRLESVFSMGHLSQLKGFIKLPKANFSEIQIEKLRFDFNISETLQNMTVNLDRMKLKKSNPFSPYFRAFLGDEGEEFSLSQVQGGLEGDQLKNLRWKKIYFRESKREFLSSGQWDETGRIEGVLQQIRPTPMKNWLITGTRDQPQIARTGKSDPIKE